MPTRQSRNGSTVNLELIEQVKLEWEDVVDTLPQLVCLLDHNGHIIRANRTVERWEIGNVKEVKGSNMHRLMHPDCQDAECPMRSFWLLAVGHVSSTEDACCECEIEDVFLQRQLHLSYQSVMFCNHQHSELHSNTMVTVAIVEDISERIHNEHKLKLLNHTLKKHLLDRALKLSRTNLRLKKEIASRMQVEQTLRTSESQLRTLSLQVMAAQEMERQRIAAELHDGIGQTLSAVKYYVETTFRSIYGAQFREDSPDFAMIVGKIRSAIEEVRRISMDLRPSILDDLGVLAALQWFWREFRVIYSGIRLKTSIQLQEDDIPLHLKLVVFRIIQEAMNNAAKHSHASRLTIHLHKTVNMTIKLSVRDNGQGFDQKTAHVGQHHTGSKIGLLSMRERSESSGGIFNITTAQGRGTAIQVAWPCDTCLKPQLTPSVALPSKSRNERDPTYRNT